MNGHEHLARPRAAQLHAGAAEYRLARTCRRSRRRPGLALRLYARLWWASRPRVESWSPALLDH